MIDKNDKIANILSKLNIICIFLGLIGGVFLYLDLYVFNILNKVINNSIVGGLGFFFLLTGLSTFVLYFYLLLRWLKRVKECKISEYWVVSYIEIEGNGVFEKYYPVMENLIGRELFSKYTFPKDSFSVGENIEVLWDMNRTEYIISKYNYTFQFIGLIIASLFMYSIGFSFIINQHVFLFILFTIIIVLILILCDSIQSIKNKNS